MKILVTGLSDAYFAPMLRGFLNYYLPEDSKLYCTENDVKPSKLSIKLMDSVGIDITKRISSSLSDTQIHTMDLIISTTEEASNFVIKNDSSKNVKSHHLNMILNSFDTEKELKKNLKKVRKHLQKFSEQLLEKVES
ncbi:MAG: hypothetical protein WBG46_15115 [Nonlabens sp.]